MNKAKFLFFSCNFWPPYLGAGIRVKNFSFEDLSVTTRLLPRTWTKTLNGAHFGGSIYAMTDLMYAALWSTALGKNYRVWDLSANVEFKKYSKNELVSHFKIDQKEVEEMKMKLSLVGKTTWTKRVDVHDSDGILIATVNKTLYLRMIK